MLANDKVAAAAWHGICLCLVRVHQVRADVAAIHLRTYAYSSAHDNLIHSRPYDSQLGPVHITQLGCRRGYYSCLS
jgi:hypothetical protein